MNSFIKKFFSVLMAVLMLLSAVPLAELVDIELPETELVPEAEAAYNGLSSYNAAVAVQWALDNWNLNDSVLFGQNYWDTGGDCANFVSQCIYMGGLDMTPQWHINGYLSHYYSETSDGTFIRAQQLHDYCVSLGATSINNPSASQVSVGDLMFYRAAGSYRMTHSAIVVDIRNGVPIIAAHSARDAYRNPVKYITTENQDWHLGFTPANTYLVKMYGNDNVCKVDNPRDFDVYTAGNGDTRLYHSTSTSSGYETYLRPGEYAHIYTTKYANGYEWGYTCRYGFYGWVKLSSLYYQRNVKSYTPSHEMGAWFTSKAPTCVTSGEKRRECNKCDYYETEVISGGSHDIVSSADCTKGGYCGKCGEMVEAPLGHIESGWVTTVKATCTTDGYKENKCTRCSKLIASEVIPAKSHDYKITVTAPSCFENGTQVSECVNCGHKKIDYVNGDDTWSGWTTEYRSDVPADKVQSKKQYRIRYKLTDEFYEPINDSRWTLYRTDEYVNGWGSWQNSPASDAELNSYGKYDVETRYIDPVYKTEYVYFHYCNDRGSIWANCVYDTCVYRHIATFDSPLTSSAPNTEGEGTYWFSDTACPNGCTKWYKGTDYKGTDFIRTVLVSEGYTQYRYRTYTYIYRYYMWDNWSNWVDEKITPSNEYEYELEERTVYRYDLAAVGHDFSVPDGKENKAPTCTEEGYRGMLCSRCGAYSPESAVIPPLGHDMGAWYSFDASIDGTVYERRDCKRTNCTYYELRDNKGTIYTYEKSVPATCSEDGYDLYVNKDENASIRVYTEEALGHTETDWLTVKNATCTEEGLQISYCARYDDGATCSYVFNKAIEPTGHTEVVIDEIPATCTEDGKTAGIYCSECRETLVEPQVIKAEGHKRADENGYENWVVISEAGCDKVGVSHLYCAECKGLIEEKFVDALIPEYIVESEKAATCTESGYIVYTCKNCVNTADAHGYTEISDKKDHTWSDWADEIIADEDNCVISVRDCSACGEHEQKSKFSQHEFTEVVISGECADGLKLVCDNCGYEKLQSEASSHDMGEWVVVKEALCQESGLKKRECKNGDYTETEIIPALEHNYTEGENVSATCTEAGYITMVCLNDENHSYKKYTSAPLNHDFTEEIPDEAHLFVEADCEASARYFYDCVRCDEIGSLTYAYGDALGHDWNEGVIDPEGTCVTEGVITYTCNRDSSHTYKESAGFGKHDMDEWYVAIPSTCTKKGTEKRECKSCDYEESRALAVNSSAHTPAEEYIVTKKASCTENGEKALLCTGCGVVTATAVINKRAHSYDNGTVIEESTCTTTGTIRYNCINEENEEYDSCTYSYTSSLSVLGHDMGKWYIIKTAQYHVPGLEKRDCQRDGCSYSETREYEIAVPTYVATFVIGDEVISKVEFEHDATSIKEPAIPEKTNYIGMWEDYEIVNENFTVNGYYELIDSDTVSSVEGEKTAEYKNDTAEITLSAFAPTKIVEYISPNTDPLDIVLVLDQSGSMAQKLKGNVTKKDALKKSANAFLQEIYENGEKAGVDHRVAVVGFAYGASNAYENTELLSYVANGKISPVKYNQIKRSAANAEKYYKNAFISISDGKGVNSLLTSAISKVDASGATAADFGLEMTSKIFDYNYSEENLTRKKLVIFITDGEPNYHSGFDISVANSAIGEAFALKQSGCYIYSVGISADADPDEFTSSSTSFNRFLHLVSSNYKNSTTMISEGSGNKNNGFYLAVNDTANLDKLFEVIVSRAVNKTVAFDNITLYDTISSEFTLTVEQEDALREKMFNEYGLTDESLEIIRNEDGTTTVKFIGLKPEKVFENGINTGFGVSVTFNVTANENAVNKGTYETNTENAGVVIDGETVTSFDVPSVSIPADRNIVIFVIGNEVFAVREGNMGEKIVAPECDYASWDIPENAVISDRVTVFTADGVAGEEYAVTWVIGEESIVEYYVLGEKLSPPAVTAEDGFLFTGFAPYVPSRMPAKNIVLTAMFEEHEHKFTETLVGGTCVSGLVIRHSCYCGLVYNVTLAPQAHKYSATVMNADERLEDNFVCENCYIMLDASLSFCFSDGTANNKFYSLEMKKGEVTVQPDGAVTVKIPLTSDLAQSVANGNKIVFYRIESDNTITPVNAVLQDNAFITVELDHFSYYVMALADSNGNVIEYVNFSSVKCGVDGHSYNKTVVPPTCTENGYTIYRCSVCKAGYTGDSTNSIDHADNDNNGYCDYCGEEMPDVANCGHMCHKDGFLGFIWDILCFFMKLFKTNPVCECGMAHY